MTQKIIIGVIALILVGAGVYYFFFRGTSLKETLVSTAEYSCDMDKTIKASYYEEGKVKLVLSDGRNLELPLALSASGARYANADESIVFWNKGNTAFITEGSDTNQTYTNCLFVDPTAPARTSYASSTMSISAKYPADFTLNESYAYEGVPNKPIHGVKFTIPGSMATGTNLSMDSGVSIEQLPRAKKCTADIFFYENVKASPVAMNGVAYSVATSNDAAAGNRYDETVYAISDSKPCTGIRYFIHYGAIENYEPGAVTAFNRDALTAAFDAIRDSVHLTTSSAATTTTP